jgi:hypothetical protein
MRGFSPITPAPSTVQKPQAELAEKKKSPYAEPQVSHRGAAATISAALFTPHDLFARAPSTHTSAAPPARALLPRLRALPPARADLVASPLRLSNLLLLASAAVPSAAAIAGAICLHAVVSFVLEITCHGQHL